jgi:CDP-diacylglycerol--glycerol-3-phosphate 3-phosphatidyltransferase
MISPNYYYLVNKRVWELNWSPLGKVFNNGLVTALLVLTRSPVLVTTVVVAILVVKFYSVALVFRTPAPAP